MTNIPNDDEFERASRLMEERSRNLDEIRDLLKQHFSKLCPLCDFYILPQRDVNFRAYVFFEKDSDIEKCKIEGIIQEIENFVFNELERFGRGSREEIAIDFELDSNENVKANFEGNYFLRMR